MNKIVTWLCIPLGWIFLQILKLCSNYGVAIILFAIFIKLVLLPFSYKSKKADVANAGIQTRIKELEKECHGDKKLFQSEVEKLYMQSDNNPLAGCFWKILPYPILVAFYGVISNPLTTVMRISTDALSKGGALYEKAMELGFESVGTYTQINLTRFIYENWEHFSGLSDKLIKLSYNFLGVDLSVCPVMVFKGNAYPWLLLFSVLAIAFQLIGIVLWVKNWIKYKMKKGKKPENSPILLLFSIVLMGGLSLSVPAAICLYWFVSSALTYLFAMAESFVGGVNNGKAKIAYTEAISRMNEEELNNNTVNSSDSLEKKGTKNS